MVGGGVGGVVVSSWNGCAMVRKHWSIFVWVTIVVVLLVAMGVLLKNRNPFDQHFRRLAVNHESTLSYGSYIDIYDASSVNDDDKVMTQRLFIVRPENLILYNYGRTVYYYLQNPVGVRCHGTAHPTIRFDEAAIKQMNETGKSQVVCVNSSSLRLVDYFVNLKGGRSDAVVLLEVEAINYTVLEMINLLVERGLCQM